VNQEKGRRHLEACEWDGKELKVELLLSLYEKVSIEFPNDTGLAEGSIAEKLSNGPSLGGTEVISDFSEITWCTIRLAPGTVRVSR